MKFFGWTIRIMIAILGIGLFLAQSQSAKKSSLEFILNSPLKESSYSIEVEGVRGLFPFKFEVDTLNIRDGNKEVSSLSDIAIIWSVPALLSKKIQLTIIKGKEISGDLLYRIDKRTLFLKLTGDGLPLGNKALLTSLIIDLPKLDKLAGKIKVGLNNDQRLITLAMSLEELDDDRFSINNITLAGPKLKGDGNVMIHLKKETWEARGTLSIENLALYNAIFDQDIEGALSINCLKTPNKPISLELVLKKLIYGENVKAETLTANALIKGINNWNLSLQSKGTVINNIPLTHLSATASQIQNKNSFELVGQGPKNISLKTQGTITLPSDNNSQTIVTLLRAELTHPLHQLLLKEPSTIALSDHEIKLPKVSLTVGKGTISIQDFVVHQHLLSGDVLIDQLPLTILQVMNPEWKGAGYLNGKAQVRGTIEQPEAEVSIEGKSLNWRKEKKKKFPTTQPSFGLDLKSGFKLRDKLLTWQLSLDSRRAFSLTTKGKVSANDLSFKTPQTLEGSLKGDGDLGALSVLISNGDLIKGKASINLTATGTTMAPQIKGHVSVTNGLYENAAFGTLIRNINLQANASNDRITLSSFTGQDNTKGRINGHGTIKLTSLLNPEVDATLTLTKLMVVQNDEISARASGALSLQGTLLGEENVRGKIKGDITIHPLELHLDNHSEDLTTIKLLEKKRNGTYKPLWKSKEKHQRKKASFLPLDINITSPNQIYLRGFGLDSQWKANLHAIGTLTDPQLTGDMTLIRGKFDLLGKPLQLQEGRITFSHDPKNDPILLIVGTREIAEVSASMRVEGRASDPKILFLSNPALPQEEILSRLLFGRGIQSISITQSLLLANALRTFQGKNSLNFTDKLRSAFGLDALEFKERKSSDGDNTESSSQMVSVGKQITDKVYLSLDQGVSGEGGTSATIQYDVTPSFKVEADVGGDTNTGVGFAWVKKY